MKYFIFTYLAASTILFGSCTLDKEELQPKSSNDGESHCVTMRFVGGVTLFDSTTRAATTDWADGTCLYIHYQAEFSTVVGKAIYNKANDQWSLQYNGNITEGEEAKCEVYYFEDTPTSTQSALSLSSSHAVYADTLASYILKPDELVLTAHLVPLTGRVRFRGVANSSVSVSGLKWYSSYDASYNVLSEQIGDVTLTVEKDGYTPYVYASFAKAKELQLYVINGNEDYRFSKNFDKTILAEGKSGYMDIPTLNDNKGWEFVSYRKKYTITSNEKAVSFNMILVQPGTFQMGRAGEENVVTPVHPVTLTKSYYIGETEVTQNLWYAVTGQSPTSDGSTWSSSYGKGDSYPAYYISYEDCQKFLTKLNQLTGQQFRFPTEAEWEFAAKGGTKSRGFIYAGSNTPGDVAWYTNNSYRKTQEVKTKAANELGLYDMSGNVWEWCLDWYGSYSSSAQTNPTGPSTGSNRVRRGGSWVDNVGCCRVAYRANYTPTSTLNDLGLRLAL